MIFADMPDTQHQHKDEPPTRVAPPARVPDGTRVYAIGDIHGRADLLAALHQKIRADAAGAGTSRLVLVHLGDYVDRGPESRQVLDMLASQPLDGFETVNLKGNHEDFMLVFLDTGALGPEWLMNGGSATLKSYDIGMFSLLFGDSGIERLRNRLAKALPPAHDGFLRGLTLYHQEGDYVFVHAGIRPGIPLEAQDEYDLMWIRHDFLQCDDDFGRIVVHGHSIRPKPDEQANRIGIDTGAYQSNRLTCLVLEGDSRRFLST